MDARESIDARAQGGGITRLGYALLGLIRREPRSGYALRKVFETTPLGRYSSSPGSIYPALKSLAKAGLVALSAPGGGKQVYVLTPAGQEALSAWLARPVDEEEVGRHIDLALLRFAFLQDEADAAGVGAFLDSFEAAAKAHAASLEAFLASPAGLAMTLHSRVAVEHGLRSIRCSAEWAADARAKLTNSTGEGGKGQ